jgi:hypothetical protein
MNLSEYKTDPFYLVLINETTWNEKTDSTTEPVSILPNIPFLPKKQDLQETYPPFEMDDY